jgi:hypothetical protein
MTGRASAGEYLPPDLRCATVRLPTRSCNDETICNLGPSRKPSDLPETKSLGIVDVTDADTAIVKAFWLFHVENAEQRERRCEQ